MSSLLTNLSKLDSDEDPKLAVNDPDTGFTPDC